MKQILLTIQGVEKYLYKAWIPTWHTARVKICTLLFGLIWLLTKTTIVYSAPLSNGPRNEGTNPSLSSALNADGTLRAGAQGSFNASQFVMHMAPNGRPTFSPTQAM